MSKWTVKRLGDISDMCLGKMLDKEKNQGDYQPYLANINVRWGGFDLKNLSKMRFEEKEDERYGLKYGDLIICEGGEPGRCAIWKDEVPEMKIQKALHRVRMHDNYNPFFVYYRFLLAGRSGELSKHFIGSTIKHLTGIGLKQVEFEYPSLAIQNQIAAVLSSIDQKIEINNRINAELEAMAKTLYDYWFVQFDFPDENGKPYKSSGGKMFYSKELKREIPAGWEATVLGDFCSAIRGVTYSKTDVKATGSKNSAGILRATNISENKLDINNLVYVNDSLIDKQQYMNQGDILIVMSSGSKNHIGKNGVYYFKEKVAFGAFCSKLSLKGNFSSYINNFLGSGGFKTHIANSCLGTNINNLTNQHIAGCMLIKPEQSILTEFEKHTSEFYKKIAISTQENQRLAALRDWLLPMLMNGQVRVDSAADDLYSPEQGAGTRQP